MASKIRVYGEAQNRTALGIIHAFMMLNPDATIIDLRKAFPDDLAPDKGVTDIFIDEKFDDNRDHYFTEEEELITTADGRKIALAKMWTRPSYDNLVKRASDYGIEVAEYENQKHVGKKGSYHIENVNGYNPMGDKESRRGCLAWMWVLMAITVLFIVAILMARSCRSADEPAGGVMIDTATAVTAPESTDGTATPVAATASGESSGVSADFIDRIEKYQQQFDAIEFPAGEFNLKPEAKQILDNVAKLMNSNPAARLTVNGYASREGNPDANRMLSEKRAASVVNYLVSQGVSAERLKAVGLSSSNPISKELSPNRRIDFIAE